MIEISEIYSAPQGEGPFLGRQMLFVRVNKCPLSCNWCDTRFTWDKSHPDYGKGVIAYKPDELAGEMLDRSYFDAKQNEIEWAPMAVSFTGGEPMVYQRDLPLVIDLFRREFKVPIEVETSGIIMPSHEMIMRCHFIVSQKLLSSGNKDIAQDKLFNKEITRVFALQGASFKVVVAPEDEEQAVPQYISWLRKVTKGTVPWNTLRTRIFLMPEGVTAKRIAERQGPVIELAQKLGVCATTRMHITAWNDERGT